MAWLNPKSTEHIKVIRSFPGDDNERKVPSLVAKTLLPHGKRKWGFRCANETPEIETWRFLKMCLDPEFHASCIKRGLTWVPRDKGEVHSLVTYYLGELYSHIRGYISDANGWTTESWDEKGIEFAFSVPTTWEEPAILDSFKGIIHAAGFGTCRAHEIVLSLTEPEAAAVAYMCGPGRATTLQPGDVFLTVDAGGGTTDLALSKVVGVEPLHLDQVHQVQGTGIGSMQIDLAFQRLVKERLRRHPEMADQLPANLDMKLAQSLSYRTRKHNLGRAEQDQEDDSYTIEIPGVHFSFTCEELGIRHGHLVVAR